MKIDTQYLKEEAKKALKEQVRKANKEIIDREWYSGRSLFGNDWAMLYALLGGREAGKSYYVTNFFCTQWKKKGRPFYWLRLTEASARKLLQNNAEKLIDPDIRRRLKLDLVTNGDGVYEVTRRSAPDKNGHTKVLEKKLMARVLALSTFYNSKGSGLFDADFLKDPNQYYNICLDEMNREANEKNTFDILYAFTNQIENLIRSTKSRVRIVLIGNTLAEASDLLSGLNFIPIDFGRYYLRSKRAVIDYIEPSEHYKQRRKGTIADILMPDASTFTNKYADNGEQAFICTKRLEKPHQIIDFGNNVKFTIWDNNIVAQYHGEVVSNVVAMRPFLNILFTTEQRDNIILQFDQCNLQYHDLITFKKFKHAIQLLKPRK